MNSFRSLVAVLTTAFCASPVVAGSPVVSDVIMTQDAKTREVTITYALSAPAVVTMDVETNGPNGWISIGGEHVACVSPDSDVFRKVSGKETYVIRWAADVSWNVNGLIDPTVVRPVLTAWPLDNTPDYMVIDLTRSAATDAPRYYPSVAYLPDGIGSMAYRTWALLMRKITAKNIQWLMGSVHADDRSADEVPHVVTLDHNYYIGVFEISQAQWKLVAGTSNSSNFYLEGRKTVRPVEFVSYNAIRCCTDCSEDATRNDAVGGAYPDGPSDGSFLGKLRERTAIDFDLPSEAEWEFACRAGQTGEAYWNDGSLILSSWGGDTNAAQVCRDMYNVVTTTPDRTVDETSGTALIGSYKPSLWGLYDMHGNVSELCLDLYKEDVSDNVTGAVVTESADTRHVVRGGSYATRTGKCKAATRSAIAPDSTGRSSSIGFRLCCRAGLD